MTVLRSRKVFPKVARKTSQPIASENGVIEPVTPSKSLESGNHLPESATPISGSSATELVASQLELHPEVSSNMITETGTVRRRSTRLAKKLVINEYVDTEVVSVKRKKVDSESERNYPGSEVDARSLEARALDFDLVADNSGPRMVQENMEDVGTNQSVADKDEVKDGANAVKFGMNYDSNSVRAETLSNGKQKRKLSAEITFLCQGSGANDKLEKGFLNLRSGKKVVKRVMEGDNDSDDRSSQMLESSKESEVMLTGGVIMKKGSVVDMDKDGNDGSKERRFSRADKGKVVYDNSAMSDSDSENEVVDDRVTFSPGDSNSDASHLLKSLALKPLVIDEGSARAESGTGARRRFSKEEKGKMKCGDEDSSSNHNMEPNVEILSANSSVSVSNQPVASTGPQNDIQIRESGAALNNARTAHREHFRRIARRIASRFAHFSSQDELENQAPDLSALDIPPPEADNEPEDWPGPFSTAMKIIKDRELNRNGEGPFTSQNKSEGTDIKWIPLKQEQGKNPKQLIPSLQDLCLSVLTKNADSITSLDCVPDMLRHKICWVLCDSRRMNSCFLELLVRGSPTEIRLRDCSWLSGEQFIKAFEGCITDKLTVLQLDQGGVCMPDYILPATLTRSPNSLPALTTLSLKGAYRLTDEGLKMLVPSAPNLKSVDLGQCSMLTSDGICCLVDSLRLVLRELYLDNCNGVDAMVILPSLLKLETVEVLSLAEIQTVSDDFVNKLVTVHGCRIKEIVLADCMELTDLCLKAIGQNCPGLHALDLSNLRKLTDVGICHLANGCQEIQMLKFCRSELSDEAVAAYLDIHGASLKELSLNNVTKVSNNTALSLAGNCRNLQTLDLSWCRNLTNEALGLVVDNCSSLELLKLFGCTQVTNVFLDGHSNPQVKIIGLKMTSVVQHIDIPDFLQGPLRYSSSV